MGTHSFVLADTSNLSSLLSPLKSTHRIKYTCFNVSQNFIILGATSGGLYVFKREPCSFLQLLPNKEGAINRVSISPDEKHFAFSTVKGTVCVLERNAGLGARRVYTSSEHQGSEVTGLQWNGQSDELYIGDDAGKISVISVFGFVAKNMFQSPSFQLMKLDSRIVQLDWQSDLLLVSTLTRSYLCDTIKEQYRQIGHKLREGEYGGCFYVAGDHTLPASSTQRNQVRGGGAFISLGEGEKLRDYEELQNLKLFCARPGSRLWEVHADGTVLSTHQFKQALAVPPTFTLKLQDTPNSSQQSDNHIMKSTNSSKSDISWSQQSFNFAKLLLLSNKYIFTFKKDGIYIFDPEKASVVLWNNEFVDVVDAQIHKDTIYLWNVSGSMHALTFSSLEKFLIRLYMRKQYKQCAQLCEMHNKYLMQEAPTSTKLHLLADLGTKLSNDEVAERILPLLQEISKYAQETKNVQRLDSGIFVVGNHHFLMNQENDGSVCIFPETKRADRFKDKSRSLSVSPETTRRRRKIDVPRNSMGWRKSESSSSLPELGKKSNAEIVQEERLTISSHNSRDFIDDSTEKMNKRRLDAKPNIEEQSTSDINSQEALQALKEIGQSVSSKISNSTKTLKEKWHVLEDKMKSLGQEMPQEPLDVRTADHDHHDININESKVCDSDVVHTSRPKSNLFNGKSITDFDANVSHIKALCKQISKCDNSDKDRIAQLSWKLFDDILSLYEKYRFAFDDACDNFDEKEQTQSDTTEGNVLTKEELLTYFLVTWSEKPFPFQSYFSKHVIRIICERLYDSLKSGIIVNWLQKYTNDFIVKDDFYVDQLSDIHSHQILKQDILLSRFLIVCSDLLDPQTILQCIEQCQLPCHYWSFCAVLDKYQEGALKYVRGDRVLDNTCWEWPVPLLLNAMFFMLRLDQIETSCMMGNKVSLRDVCYLVLRLQEQLVTSGEKKDAAKKRCSSLFLSYLDRSSDLQHTVESILEDQQLAPFVISALGEVNKDMGQSCECGFPLPIPHGAALQYAEIGEIILMYYWQTNHERQLQLCRKVPILWRQVLSLKQGEDLESVLPLLIQLGSVSELEKLLPELTCAKWRHVLGLLSTLRSGKCLNCGTFSVSADHCTGMLSMSSVGALIIKSLGSQTAVELLMTIVEDIRPGELDSRFFQSCIFSEIVDSHASGFRTEVVDMVNDNLGASLKTAVFSPEVGNAVKEALSKDLGKSTTQLNTSTDHHWGVSVDLGDGSCPCCALPLGSVVLLKDGGLTVFECGHSYHSVCLRQRQSFCCLVCGSKS